MIESCVASFQSTSMLDIHIDTGQVAILSINNPDDNLIYNWFDAPNQGCLMHSGIVYKTNPLMMSTTFYVETEDKITGSLSATRALITVNVNSDFSVTLTPDCYRFVCGVPLTLRSHVSRVAPYQYQWFKNDIIMPDEISCTYHVSRTSLKHAGRYTVIATNAQGVSQVSNTAHIHMFVGV